MRINIIAMKYQMMCADKKIPSVTCKKYCSFFLAFRTPTTRRRALTGRHGDLTRGHRDAAVPIRRTSHALCEPFIVIFIPNSVGYAYALRYVNHMDRVRAVVITPERGSAILVQRGLTRSVVGEVAEPVWWHLFVFLPALGVRSDGARGSATRTAGGGVRHKGAIR